MSCDHCGSELEHTKEQCLKTQLIDERERSEGFRLSCDEYESQLSELAQDLRTVTLQNQSAETLLKIANQQLAERTRELKERDDQWRQVVRQRDEERKEAEDLAEQRNKVATAAGFPVGGRVEHLGRNLLAEHVERLRKKLDTATHALKCCAHEACHCADALGSARGGLGMSQPTKREIGYPKRSPIAALLVKLQESGKLQNGQHVSSVADIARELEAAIAAQVEVMEARKPKRQNNVSANLRIELSQCIKDLKGEP